VRLLLARESHEAGVASVPQTAADAADDGVSTVADAVVMSETVMTARVLQGDGGGTVGCGVGGGK
jgi:hypothetical protein